MASEAVAGEPEGERIEELAVRLERLREENDRLREEYARARRASHRRAASGLAALGVIAVGAGLLFPAERPVLLAIGSIGLFAAILTAYLTPERFVAASVGEGVYAQLSETLAALVGELALTETRIYVPVEGPRGHGIRLFIPQHDSYVLPDDEALQDVLVIPDDDRARGLATRPTGAALYDALDAGEAADAVATADVLAESIVETFELADGVLPEVDAADGRASFAVSGSVYGALDRLDHPIPSILACGLAETLELPVEVSVTRGDERADYLVTCRWGTDERDGSRRQG